MRDKNSMKPSPGPLRLRDTLAAGTALPLVGSIPSSQTALDLSGQNDLVIRPEPSLWRLLTEITEAGKEDRKDTKTS